METREKIGTKIIGSWELVSWIFKNEKGEKVKYFGQQPKGILIYQDSGIMSVQIAQENRPSFSKQGIDEGTQEEMTAAFASFLSYYGSYKETEPGVFVHTVLGSLFPNWLGHKETRLAAIDGNNLVLSTPPTPTSKGDIEFIITWKKNDDFV